MKKTLLMTAMMLTALVASAKDIKTVVLTTTPQMHCESCENKIKGNLKFEKGVKDIETNVKEQKVTVKYDADRTTPCNIVAAFSKFGYTAQPVEMAQKGGCKESKPGCCKAQKEACNAQQDACTAKKSGCSADGECKQARPKDAKACPNDSKACPKAKPDCAAKKQDGCCNDK